MRAVAGRDFTAYASGFESGLVGTITFGVFDGDQAILAPRTAGITEIQESGSYTITVTAPSTGDFTIVWDDQSGSSAIEDLEVTESPGGEFSASPTTAELAAVIPVWALDVDGRMRSDFADESGVEGDPGFDAGTPALYQTLALKVLADAENDVVARLGPLNDSWDAMTTESVKTLILHRAVYLAALGKIVEDPAMAVVADQFLKLTKDDLASAQSAVARWGEENGTADDLVTVPAGRFTTGIHGYDPLSPTFEQPWPGAGGAHPIFPGAGRAYWLLGPDGVPRLVVPGP